MVIPEKFLNGLALIAQAKNEFFVTEAGVGFHDVPENRPLADRHHRLGAKFSLFTQARAQATTKNHNFHLNLVGPVSPQGSGIRPVISVSHPLRQLQIPPLRLPLLPLSFGSSI